jgi:hypothetical protein
MSLQLTQGMISRVLSKTYDHLDSLDGKKDKKFLQSSRESAGDWPDLEAALFKWQQRMQETDAVVTGEILKIQASKLWAKLPQYEHLEEPKWSNGWLQGFEERFKIKEYVRHGEAGSVAIDDPDNTKQIDDLRGLASTYAPEDILNIDESGLCWKMSPDRSLATKASSGGKKSKDRITVALTSNATGTDDIKPWIVGKSKNPRCLKNINRRLLRIEYRYNKSK